MRALLLVCLISLSAFGQGAGTMAGTVSDRMNAPIGEVAIQVKSAAT